MKCKNISFGTYDCSYTIMLPYKVMRYGQTEGEKVEKYVCIDKCLIQEIIQLWEMGIKTTGCCCGHGKNSAYIGVENEFIPKMKQLGYVVAYNPCRPDDEDSFIPKTTLKYGKIKKCFSMEEI